MQPATMRSQATVVPSTTSSPRVPTSTLGPLCAADPALTHHVRHRCRSRSRRRRCRSSTGCCSPRVCGRRRRVSRQSMWTALHWAVTNEHTDCAKSLIKAGADTSLRDKVRHGAARRGGGGDNMVGGGGGQPCVGGAGKPAVTAPPPIAPLPSSPLPASLQRGETALDFAKYNSNKGETIPLLDKVGRASQPPDLALALSHSLGHNQPRPSVERPQPQP